MSIRGSRSRCFSSSASSFRSRTRPAAVDRSRGTRRLGTGRGLRRLGGGGWRSVGAGRGTKGQGRGRCDRARDEVARAHAQGVGRAHARGRRTRGGARRGAAHAARRTSGAAQGSAARAARSGAARSRCGAGARHEVARDSAPSGGGGAGGLPARARRLARGRHARVARTHGARAGRNRPEFPAKSGARAARRPARAADAARAADGGAGSRARRARCGVARALRLERRGRALADGRLAGAQRARARVDAALHRATPFCVGRARADELRRARARGARDDAHAPARLARDGARPGGDPAARQRRGRAGVDRDAGAVGRATRHGEWLATSGSGRRGGAAPPLGHFDRRPSGTLEPVVARALEWRLGRTGAGRGGGKRPRPTSSGCGPRPIA